MAYRGLGSVWAAQEDAPKVIASHQDVSWWPVEEGEGEEEEARGGRLKEVSGEEGEEGEGEEGEKKAEQAQLGEGVTPLEVDLSTVSV